MEVKLLIFIPLRNSPLSRCIDEMVKDAEKQLIVCFQVKQFIIQLYESTLEDNDAIILAYLRFIDDNELRKENAVCQKS